jgi:hypothetical protein
MNEAEGDTGPIDPAVLKRVVSQALGSPEAQIDLDSWQAQPATAGRGAATAGIYRVSGIARERDMPREWSIMLKLIRPGAAAWNPAAREMDHPTYWKREVLAYQTGLLESLPGGVTAPRCFAVDQVADECCRLWLMDVRDSFFRTWPLEQYCVAATALGRFNGAYLAGHPLPSSRWLGRPGALRATLEGLAFVQDQLRDPTTWDNPLLASSFSANTIRRLLQLWKNRALLLDRLDQMPKTLCHKDAFRRNMFAAEDAFVLIDWAYVGVGELGLDAADLFAASYGTFCVDSADVAALEAAVFDNYLAGLRAAGWAGADRLARFGFAASAALKYCCALVWLADVANAARSADCHALSGQPLDVFVSHQARLISHLLDLADEAFALGEICRGQTVSYP